MPRKANLKLIVPQTTAIHLPSDLVAAVQAKLDEREIELETFIAIYLRMMLRSKTVLGLEDKMPFGKYQGELVEHVVRIDPAYVSWLITQDGRTKLKPEVVVLVAEMQEL